MQIAIAVQSQTHSTKQHKGANSVLKNKQSFTLISCNDLHSQCATGPQRQHAKSRILWQTSCDTRTRSNCFTRIPRAYKTPTIFRLSKCAGATTELQTNIEHANWHKRTNKNKLAWMHEQLFFGHTINFCHPQSSSLHDSQKTPHPRQGSLRKSSCWCKCQRRTCRCRMEPLQCCGCLLPAAQQPWREATLWHSTECAARKCRRMKSPKD